MHRFATTLLLLILPLAVLSMACTDPEEPAEAGAGKPGPPPHAAQSSAAEFRAPMSLGDWAPRFCEAADLLQLRQESASRSLAERYGTNVDAMTLEQRKARSQESTNLLVFAFDDAVAHMRQLGGPPEVSPFVIANIRQLQDLAQALIYAEQRVQAAHDMSEIDAASGDLLAAARASGTDVATTAKAMPPEAHAALRSVPHCGSVTSG